MTSISKRTILPILFALALTLMPGCQHAAITPHPNQITTFDGADAGRNQRVH